MDKTLRDARRRGPVAPDVTSDGLVDMYDAQHGRCALSGVAMTSIWGQGPQPTNISVDRIDPDGPYTTDNIRLVCYAVNMMQRRMSDDDFLRWCAQIVRTTRAKNK